MITDEEHDSFERWWDAQGKYCRAGGGEYEETFAYRAWQAALKLGRSRSAGLSRQHIGQLDRADLAFIYDELKQSGCERAASLVSRALSATPEPVIRDFRTTETMRWPGEFDGAHHIAEPSRETESWGEEGERRTHLSAL